jgi:hypothetical protein
MGSPKDHPCAGPEMVAGPGKIWVMELGTGGRCGADLNGAPDGVASYVQVSGISSAALTQYRMMRRTWAAGRSRPHWPAGGHGRPSVLRLTWWMRRRC